MFHVESAISITRPHDGVWSIATQIMRSLFASSQVFSVYFAVFKSKWWCWVHCYFNIIIFLNQGWLFLYCLQVLEKLLHLYYCILCPLVKHIEPAVWREKGLVTMVQSHGEFIYQWWFEISVFYSFGLGVNLPLLLPAEPHRGLVLLCLLTL